MKKIYSLLIILFTCTIISCSDSSSSDLPNEYIDPFGNPPETPNSAKSYYIAIDGSTKASTGYPSGSPACKAVIYQGTSYTGIAVEDASGTFKLKIYWDSTIDTTTPIPSNQYTIKVLYSSGEYISTPSSGNLNITIAPPTAGISNITISGPINLYPSSGAGSSIPFTSATINAFIY